MFKVETDDNDGHSHVAARHEIWLEHGLHLEIRVELNGFN